MKVVDDFLASANILDVANRLRECAIRKKQRQRGNQQDWPRAMVDNLGEQERFIVCEIIDPIRLKPAMPAAVLEKLGFVVAIAVLYAMSRVDAIWVGLASLDALWGVLFAVAYARMKSTATPRPPATPPAAASS